QSASGRRTGRDVAGDGRADRPAARAAAPWPGRGGRPVRPVHPGRDPAHARHHRRDRQVMRVIATYNIKGGVGKTSAAVNLAYLSATGGYRTLLWDLD